MAFIRTKKVKGRLYRQLVESYRDENGKVKQRVLEHLGKDEGARMKDGISPHPPTSPSALSPQHSALSYSPGDRVWFLHLWNGKDEPHQGTVVEVLTQIIPLVRIRHAWGESDVPPLRVIGRVFKIGAWVQFVDHFDGLTYGTVIGGETQVSACEYPLEEKVRLKIVKIPYDQPGTVTIRYDWFLTKNHVVTKPVNQVWVAGCVPSNWRDTLPPPNLAGHGKDPTRIQGSLI